MPTRHKLRDVSVDEPTLTTLEEMARVKNQPLNFMLRDILLNAAVDWRMRKRLTMELCHYDARHGGDDDAL